MAEASEMKLSGGLVNYYLVQVSHPQRSDQEPYQAECEDIIEALELNPDEANIFKEIWRSANARKANGKPGHKALYGAEKIAHYAGRILKRLRLQAENQKNQEKKLQASTQWIPWTGLGIPELPANQEVETRLRSGATPPPQKVGDWNWKHRGWQSDIVAYRIVE